MKWIITILAIACTTVACEKTSPLVENKDVKDVAVAGVREETKGLVGTWQLLSYWEDAGNGTGRWVNADFNETIMFGADGSFSSTPTFPLYDRNYSKYITKDNGFVSFYPAVLTTDGDRYQYTLASPTELLFYPLCRETCVRRYQLK